MGRNYISIPNVQQFLRVEIWECISSFISHCLMGVITYPCYDESLSTLAKWAQGIINSGNVLPPTQPQGSTWTKAALLSFGFLGTQSLKLQQKYNIHSQLYFRKYIQLQNVSLHLRTGLNAQAFSTLTASVPNRTKYIFTFYMISRLNADSNNQ